MLRFMGHESDRTNVVINTYSFTGLEIIAIDRVSGIEHFPGV